MSIKITYTFPSEENAIEFMQRVAELTLAPVEPRPFEPVAKARDELRAEQNVTACNKPDLSKAEREARKARTKKAPPAEPVPVGPFTREHARLALTELMSTKGMEACNRVLAGAQVRRISELTDYAGFVAACQAVACETK